MVEGDKSANFLAFDYLISIFHNIKTEEMIKNELADADPISIQMEYLNLPAGSSSKGYYKFSMFKRNIKRAWYPMRDEEYDNKKNPYAIKKTDSELRFISADIATRAGRANDNTILACPRCIPNMGKGYQRELVYMESSKGQNVLQQAKRIKELFFDFEADYIVLDLQNAGIGIFDALSQVTRSDERGIDFQPMTVADSDFIDEKLAQELRGRTLGLNALPVIFPILASKPLNSQMAVAFRNSLKKKMWNFLIPEGDAEEFLMKTNKEFYQDVESSENFAFFMNPYIQQGLLIGECVNLDMSLSDGMIRLVEKTGNYKDRYSTLSYVNWVISDFDKDLLKETESNEEDFLRYTMVR
jgi:hypothetical protein